MTALAELAVCPRCGDALTADFGCKTCKIAYPVLGGVPCLLPAFARWQRRWAEELGVLHAEADRTISVFEEALRRPALLPRTRARLTRQRDLTVRMRAEVGDALAPIGPAHMPEGPLEGFRPLESVHRLHRDWAWPESRENQAALDGVMRVRRGAMARVLVLGAGAGRLAYDVHRASRAGMTIAVDVDPLVSLLAHRVCAGEEIPFVEGNSAALDETSLDAPRLLRAPNGAADGLHFVLADGLAPPFRAHAFDTIVTPWFVDLVPPDLRDFFGVLDRMLEPGGQWISYGPLLYPPSRPVSTRFTMNEIEDLANLAGFTIDARFTEAVPYSVSPLGGRGRVESCVFFCARKGDGAAAIGGGPPPWLVLPHLPVPAFTTPARAFDANGAFALIAGMVDGARSIDDITRAIVARTGTAAPGTKDTVRFCLSEIHPGAGR